MIGSSRRLTAGLIAGALTAAVTGLTGAAFADKPAPVPAPTAAPAPEPADPVMNALAGQPQEAPADPAIAAGPPAPSQAPAQAQPQPPAQGTPLSLRPAPAPFGAGQSPTSLMPQLALVALIGAAGLWMWKRRSALKTEPSRAPRILARTPVGVRSELLVVEVDGQQMLIGVTPQTIQRIAVLSQINVAATATGNVLIQDLPDEPGFRSLWNDDTLRDVEPPRHSYPAQSLAEAAARMNAMARTAAASRAVAAGSNQTIPKARTIKGAPLPPESGTHRVMPVGNEVEEQARGLLDARGRR